MRKTRKVPTSSKDKRVIHPYVVEARIQAEEKGDNTPWTTSKITRKKDGNIGIKIFQR